MGNDNERAQEAAALQDLVGTLQRLSTSLARAGGVRRSKPVLGGAFGAAGFCLASSCYVVDGLDRVAYFVLTEKHGFVIGMGDDKCAAMAAARSVIGHLGAARVAALAAGWRAERDAAEIVQRAAASAAVGAADTEATCEARAVRSVSRKRRRLFTEAGGQCHYCKCDLQLTDSWHVDHKLPRALGGGNEPENLAVACSACNLAKADKTDVEFSRLLDGGKLEKVRGGGSC